MEISASIYEERLKVKPSLRGHILSEEQSLDMGRIEFTFTEAR